jgi:hypothetical protein
MNVTWPKVKQPKPKIPGPRHKQTPRINGLRGTSRCSEPSAKDGVPACLFQAGAEHPCWFPVRPTVLSGHAIA